MTQDRILLLGIGATFGMVLGVFVTISIQRAWMHSKDSDCDQTSIQKYSPDGTMRALLTKRVCDYGFGLNASFASLRIEKLGKDGWFVDEPLKLDQPPEDSHVIVVWKGNDLLEAQVTSKEYSGSLERRINGFSFVQEYVHPEPAK